MQLVVGVRTRYRIGEPGPDIRLHLAALHLARQLGRSAPRWPPDENEPPWPDPQTWSPVTISIDRAPVELRSLTDSDRWVAVGTVGEMVVTLESRRFPVDLVSLTTVSDLEPYVAGARARRDRIWQAHNNE